MQHEPPEPKFEDQREREPEATHEGLCAGCPGLQPGGSEVGDEQNQDAPGDDTGLASAQITDAWYEIPGADNTPDDLRPDQDEPDRDGLTHEHHAGEPRRLMTTPDRKPRAASIADPSQLGSAGTAAHRDYA
jgi:hypothetical protein